MNLTTRAFEETDWSDLFAWAEEYGQPTTREFVEFNTPYRVVIENGSGPVAMFGWKDNDGVPFVHVVKNPKAPSMKTWNAVYDVAIETLRRCGYQKSVAMVPHGAKIGRPLRRKGWTHFADLFIMEL